MSMTADLPECRIPATVDPAAFLRFEVSEGQAEEILEHLQDEYDNSEAGDFITTRFVMNHPTYLDMLSGLGDLEDRLPEAGMKHVQLATDAEYAFTVLISQEQIVQMQQSNEEALESGGEQDLYGQEFQISRKSAIMAIRQIEEAFAGADEPVEAIDMQEIRANF